MKNLANFKAELEKTCKIVSWNPTQSQLEKIAQELARTSPRSLNDAESIVLSIYPNATFLALAGVDNSDVRTLLALAIQVANMKS